MRVLGFAIFALALAQSAAAQVVEIPETHLLLLDRSALKPADPARDGRRSEAADKTIYRDLMARHGANLILDAGDAPAHWSGLDITREAAAALHDAIPEWLPATTAAAVQTGAATAPPVRMLVADVASFGSPDDKFRETLERVAAGQGATLVVDRRAVVIGAPGFDITALVRSSLESYRNTGTPPLVVGGPDPPFARVAILDRQALVRDSAVGRDIAAQIRTITANVESELRSEAETLKSEGARLKEHMAALSPDERKKAVQDYADRREAFTAKVQKRQDEIKAAAAAAKKKMEAAASPIVFQILKDDQANILLDRMAVVAGDDALDITASTIEKLNAALPHVDVTLAPMATSTPPKSKQ